MTTNLDEDLAAAVRYTARLRMGFYFVVLLVALAGQVTGAVERLHLPWYLALPAVGALELGGMVVLSNADVRRRLGERAIASRLLSAGIAAFAVTFNWLCHADHLLGGFFAGMSFQQIAELSGRSERSLRRDWELARVYLQRRLREHDPA